MVESHSPPNPSPAHRPTAVAAFSTVPSGMSSATTRIRRVPLPKFPAENPPAIGRDGVSPSPKFRGRRHGGPPQLKTHTNVRVFESDSPPPANAPPARAGVGDDSPDATREISRRHVAKCNH